MALRFLAQGYGLLCFPIALGADAFAVTLATAAPPPGRVELHVHLDGSIGAEDLYRICVKRGIALPRRSDGGGGGGGSVPRSAEEVERYLEAIQPAWIRFDVVNGILGGDPETIRAASQAFVAFQARSGVVYTEVRYDPVRLANSSLKNASISWMDAVKAVEEGLAAGAAVHGVAVYQILSALRGQNAARCRAVARLAAAARSERPGGVVGFDLAGDESHFPNAPYIACLRDAKEILGLKTTVHAGEFEDTSPGEVSSALLDMKADRVGHGYKAVEDAGVLELLVSRGIHVEACPGSAKHHGPWALEAIRTYRDSGVNFGLNTDDPVAYLMNTSASRNERIVREELGFGQGDLERAYGDALAAAFGPEAAKAAVSASWRQRREPFV